MRPHGYTSGDRATAQLPPPPPSVTTRGQPPAAEPLTAAELDVARQLAAVHNAFCALPDYRPGEFDDWLAGVHRLQDIVMSRAAIRAYPAEFTGLFVKP